MRIVYAGAILLLWLVLSASYEFIHVLIGAITATAIVWLNPISFVKARRISWLSAITYLPWLFVRVMMSGFHVSKLILQPGLPIKPKLLHLKTQLRSDGELFVLGNSITLTPGTITIEVAPGELLVHAIDAHSQHDLSRGLLEERVSRLLSTEEKR